MKEDDLLWIIAINSAAYEQDLDAMSAELIQNFCQSTPVLSAIAFSSGWQHLRNAGGRDQADRSGRVDGADGLQ